MILCTTIRIQPAPQNRNSDFRESTGPAPLEKGGRYFFFAVWRITGNPENAPLVTTEISEGAPRASAADKGDQCRRAKRAI